MANEESECRKAIAEEMENMSPVNITLTAGDILGIVAFYKIACEGVVPPHIILVMAEKAVAKIKNSLNPSSLLFKRLESRWLQSKIDRG